MADNRKEGKVTTVRVRLFTGQFIKDSMNRGGSLDNLLKEKAQESAEQAKNLVGTYYAGQHTGPSLRSSIRATPIAPSPSWKIEATHPIALAHHEGTKPHIINVGVQGALYRKGGPVDSAGDDIFGPVFVAVRHPGTTANRFLVEGARKAGVRVELRGRNRTTFTNQESFSGTVK